MSDVPAAAAWALAVACLLAGTPASAAFAGSAASIAILIRPNLAPIAIVLAAWALTRGSRAAAAFATCAAIGPAVVALINARLHGSPFASGYDLTNGYAFDHILPNARGYLWWLLTAEPPLAVGLVVLVAAVRRLWLLASIVAVVFASYFTFVVFDAWWFLRYLLPAWPMLAVGAATLAARSGRVMGPLVVAVAIAGVWQAARRDAFALARAEAKYADVAQVVRTTTSAGDVMVSAQHSGSLRYYADRMTLRWDFMDPLWLDRAVAWLSARGQHAYVVLDADEVGAVRGRFSASSVVGRLDWPPMVSYADGTTLIFDAVGRDPQTRTVTVPRRRNSRGAP